MKRNKNKNKLRSIVSYIEEEFGIKFISFGGRSYYFYLQGYTFRISNHNCLPYYRNKFVFNCVVKSTFRESVVSRMFKETMMSLIT